MFEIAIWIFCNSIKAGQSPFKNYNNKNNKKTGQQNGKVFKGPGNSEDLALK